MSLKNVERLEFFPIDIKIHFLKVPKKQSTTCNNGFGFCFTIVITFIFGEGTSEQPETFYNRETGDVRGWGSVDLDNKTNMHIHFPVDIAESPYHSEEDLTKFQVMEDKEYGDITFIEGEYSRDECTDGYNYNVNISTQ